jgi:hypothetical protein
LLKVSKDEYTFINNVLEFAEWVENDDFIPAKPMWKKEFLAG